MSRLLQIPLLARQQADQSLLDSKGIASGTVPFLALCGSSQGMIEEVQRVLALVAGTGHKPIENTAALGSLRHPIAWRDHG